MRRIVMFAGGVETLEYFSKQMAVQFQAMGYAVFFYDLKNEVQSARKLRKFIRVGETVLVTFNFQGLEKEAGVYREGIGYVWEEYRIPCYNIAADHPYFYDDRLRELPADYHHISIDRRQQQYFRRFYPEYIDAGFLPLAGTALGEAAGAKRIYDVILTGNYTELSFFEPYINWINDEYAAFYRGIINDLLEHPEQTVEDAALAHCEREMGKEPDSELRIALHKMIFIDMYVRNYWRGKVVRALTDAGITVHVVGKGWEALEDVVRPECLIVHPQTDSETCLQMLAQAKISVNVMPWFKDGAHDRVFNSILNGAVCVSDTSEYLCEELKEGQGVCYFSLGQLESLPKKVKDLLQNESLMQDIVSKGAETVTLKHTWKNRAETVAAWFEAQERDRLHE